jgi:hypothetical protein
MSDVTCSPSICKLYNGAFRQKNNRLLYKLSTENVPKLSQQLSRAYVQGHQVPDTVNTVDSDFREVGIARTYCICLSSGCKKNASTLINAYFSDVNP